MRYNFENRQTAENSFLAIVDGVEMEYARFGHGAKTFVMLPGLSLKSVMGAADAVAAAYAMFAEEYTVYLFDRRRNLPADYSLTEMADDTAAIMRGLGIANADVFGASQGGMIALCLAARHPVLVHKLVVGSSAGALEPQAQHVLQNWIALAESRNTEALVADMVEKIYAPATVSAYGAMLTQSNLPLSDAECERFVTLARACESLAEDAEPYNVSFPVLVIGCEGDRVLTAEASRKLAERLACASYFYGNEYGHAVYDEAPDYKERILTFFHA